MLGREGAGDVAVLAEHLPEVAALPDRRGDRALGGGEDAFQVAHAPAVEGEAVEARAHRERPPACAALPSSVAASSSCAAGSGSAGAALPFFARIVSMSSSGMA